MATYKRGQIFFVKRQASTGSEIYSDRPAVIVSNDSINRCSSVVEVVYFTSTPRGDYPSNCICRSFNNSTALCNQISSVDISRLSTYYGDLSSSDMALIDSCLLISLGIGSDVRTSSSSIDDSVYKQLYESLVDKLVSLI